MLGVQPAADEHTARFTTVVHWGYGISWGAARGLLAAAGLRGPAATAAHFGMLWAAELVTLPALGVVSPATRWGPKAIGIDAWHHLVYATATGLAYERLSS